MSHLVVVLVCYALHCCMYYLFHDIHNIFIDMYVFFFSQLVMDPERHFRESQDNISNVGEHHIQKKGKLGGQL